MSFLRIKVDGEMREFSAGAAADLIFRQKRQIAMLKAELAWMSSVASTSAEKAARAQKIVSAHKAKRELKKQLRLQEEREREARADSLRVRRRRMIVVV